MSKQTAVEWLMEQLMPAIQLNDKFIKEYLAHAKAMEKEQIVDAWNGGDYAYFYSKETGRDFVDGSEYYNETYKGGQQ